jgi:hypothetical protein
MATEIKQIMDKLDHIESDLSYIKEHLSDVDLVLTDDDLESLRSAEKDLAENKTKRLI